MINLVEMCCGDDESAFNQKCKHGNLVTGHAVYCHNGTWKNAPRKCRNSWYYKDSTPEHQDENCPGYTPNPNYT